MQVDDESMYFEFNQASIALMYQSVGFYLDKWPGGPDPSEQEALHKLKTLFASALMEYSYNSPDYTS
jgi:hypothetical protein